MQLPRLLWLALLLLFAARHLVDQAAGGVEVLAGQMALVVAAGVHHVIVGER